MIVWRGTWRVKPEYFLEAIEVEKTFREEFPNPSRVRSYTGHGAGAPAYMIVRDVEFKSLADLEEWIKQWLADPDAVLGAKWQEYYVPGAYSTIWNLIE